MVTSWQPQSIHHKLGFKRKLWPQFFWVMPHNIIILTCVGGLLRPILHWCVIAFVVFAIAAFSIVALIILLGKQEERTEKVSTAAYVENVI